jgi:hypothetical protein
MGEKNGYQREGKRHSFQQQRRVRNQQKSHAQESHVAQDVEETCKCSAKNSRQKQEGR